MTSSSSLYKLAVLLGVAIAGTTLAAALSFSDIPALSRLFIASIVLLALAWAGWELWRTYGLLRHVTSTLTQACRGDLDARIFEIPQPGLIGRLQQEVNDLLDIIDAFVRETGGAAAYLGQRKYFRRVLPAGLPGAFRDAAKSLNLSADMMAGNVKEFTLFAEQNVSATTDSINAASTQLHASANAMTQIAEELSDTITLITQKADTSAHAAQQTEKEVLQAAAIVEQLMFSARQIDDITALIADISRRTDLLAINASIEAGKAGNAGNGFSVVALEIRSLSQQVGDFAHDIENKIENMRNAIHASGLAITDIRRSVEKMSQMSMDIARSISSDDETSAVSQMSLVRTVANTSEAAHQVLMAASSLSDDAEHLRGEIHLFIERLK